MTSLVETIRHHTIPSMYQTRFSPNPEAKTPQIYVYDLNSGEWTKRSIRKTAVRKKYYSVGLLKEPNSDAIENWLSVIESDAALVLRRKIDKSKSMGKEEKFILALFISTLRMRVPFIRDKLNKFTSSIAKRITLLIAKRSKLDQRYFEKLKTECSEETGYDLNDLTPDDLDPDKFEFGATKEYLIELSFKDVIKMAELLLHMHWVIYKAPSQYRFLTSDNPYCEINPLAKSAYERAGLLRKSIEVTLPLSKQQCFFASWKRIKGGMYHSISKAKIEEINRRIIASAQNIVISETPNYDDSGMIQNLLDKAFLKRKKHKETNRTK